MRITESLPMLRRVSPIALWLAVVLAAACSGTSSDQDQPQSALKAPQAESPRETRVGDSTESCVSPARGQVRLSGIIREEHRLGPPGYGETPKRDQKITILVLHLPQGLDVCADTSADDPRPAVRAVTELQVTGRLDPSRIKPHLGRPITVYGNLYYQSWGTDYTQMLIRVDSIPGIYAALPPRA